MLTLLRFIFGLAVVIAVVFTLGLMVMGGIAATNDVKPVAVPNNSYIASVVGAEQKNAFQAKMQFNSYKDIDRVAEKAFDKGAEEVARTKNEVVYKGTRMGHLYYVGYMLEKTVPNTLTVSTAIDVPEGNKKRLWPILRFIQKRYTPYQVNKMASLAPD